MKNIMYRLDNAILGKQTDVKYDESMESALGEKLNRYIDITAEENEKTAREKESIKSLISDIAHQTKTPLSNIILLTQLTQENTEIPEEPKEMINDVNIQAEKLKSLIDVLVEASYLESGLIKVTPVKEPLSTVLNDVYSELNISAQKKDITLEMASTDLQCKYDYKWTKEALINIVDNAIKYSPEESKIQIQASNLEMFTRIDIKDQGIGINENDLGRIFTRFYRSPEVNKVEGIGVGLYLAREIISMQSGYIKVSSQRGSGSVFSVYLPN